MQKIFYNSTQIYLSTIFQILCILVMVVTFVSCGNEKKHQLEKVNDEMGIKKADISIILAYEQKLIEAYKNNNLEAISELYHDNLVFNSPDGRVLSKNDDIESIKSGVLKIQEYNPGDYTVKLIDDIATVSVSIHIKGKIADNEFEGNFRFLRIWKQEDDKWSIIAISGCQVN